MNNKINTIKWCLEVANQEYKGNLQQMLIDYEVKNEANKS